jgi:4-carboxymuconolactone decarboxylase
MEVLQALEQEHADVLQRLERVAPDLARHLIAFGFGDIQSRPALDLKTRTLITVCGLGAMGAPPDQIVMHLRSARAAGWSPGELTEALMQLSVYAGFPRAVDALQALRTLLIEQNEGDAMMDGRSRGGACGFAPPNPRFERGLEVLRAFDPGEAVKILSALSDTAPDFAAYLVEYVFGDISSRPGLDLKQREFAAVAVLSAMPASTQQLEHHVRGAFALGWTQEELVELMMQVSVYGGYPAAIRALDVLDRVIRPKAP